MFEVLWVWGLTMESMEEKALVPPGQVFGELDSLKKHGVLMWKWDKVDGFKGQMFSFANEKRI